MSTRADTGSTPSMTVWRAVSLGIGSMVGAGIFSLLGEVASVATSGVWLAFLLGGVVALLNGYSYGRLGARFPSAGGPVDYLTRGFGEGVLSGGLSVFYYAAGVIGMAMVARAFGTYTASLFVSGTPSRITVGAIAAGLVLTLTVVNLAGSDSVGRAELIVVAGKLAILSVFVVGGVAGIQSTLLADQFAITSPGGVTAAVGLAFFAYTGFGVVTNAAVDMQDPAHELPRALWIAIGSVVGLYLAISLVTFGSLDVSEVIADKETALAVAARPVFGQTGFVVMAVAAMLSTASAVNANLYGSTNISYVLAKHGELPPEFDRKVWHDAPEGLFITAGAVLLLATVLDLSQVAALGSLAVLLIYIAVSIGHLRLTDETGAKRWALLAAVVTTVGAFAAFAVRLASDQPVVLVAGLGVLGVCLGLEVFLRRFRSVSPDSSVD